jgi:F-type H+-transporting ATPase subunit delta
MTDRITIARPYARAAFAEASAAGQLAAWSAALATAVQVVRDERVHALFGDPHVTPEQLTQLVADLAGPSLGEHGHNFVATLAVNGRLAFLPEISALFDELRDDAEGVADVTVTSAVALDAGQQQALSAALARRLQRTIRLHCELDPQLIGGAVLRSGDLVIDGSLSGRLTRIAHELTA